MYNNTLKKESKFTIQNTAFIIFTFFCFFPFVFPLPGLTMDMQPYAMIFSAFVLLINFNKVMKIHLPTELVVFFFLMAFALILGVISLIEFPLYSILRGIASYITLFVVALVLFVFDNVTIDKEKLFKFYILIWFFVGLIQLLFNRTFLTGIVSNGRVSYTYRGCIGLASEPSFFGMQCFYFLYVAKSFKKWKYFYFTLVTFMAIVMAQSLMAILCVAPFFLLELVEQRAGVKKFSFAFVIVAVVILTGYILLTYYPDLRLSQLINDILFSTEDEFFDGSISTREDSVVSSFLSAFDNYLIPIGFKRRIGSAWGGILCELGFLAIPYIIIIPKTLCRLYKNTVAMVLCYIVITAVYFNNIQLSNPMLAFLIGSILYKEKIKVEDKTNLAKDEKAYL